MRTNKGFTLIELLIVIAIIAILLTIIAPALQVAKEQATGAVCLGNQNKLIHAWMAYANDHKEKIVGGDTIGYRFETTGAFGRRQHFDWVEFPQDENGNGVFDVAVMAYADRIRGIEAGALFKYLNRYLKAYHCPADDRKFEDVGGSGGYRSYSVQGLLNAHDWWAEYAKAKPIRKIGSIKFPEEKYVFVEEAEKEAGYNGRSWACDPFGLVPIPNGLWDPLAVFHNEKSTLNFADGHAVIHRWQDEEIIEKFEAGTKYISSSTFGADSPDIVYLQRGVAHNGPL